VRQNASLNSETPVAPPRLVELFDRLVRPRTLAALLLSAVVIVALLAAVLAAPPISLGDRVAELGYHHIDGAGATVRQPDRAELVVPADAVDRSTPLRMDIVPLADFIARPPQNLSEAATFPSRLTLKSAVYTFDTRGKALDGAKLSMPIPTDVRDDELAMVDLYAWDGESWNWQPTTVLPDDDLVYTTLDSLPKAVALFSTMQPRASVGAMLTTPGVFSNESADVLSEVTVQGLWVDADGSLRGALDEAPAVTGARFVVVPSVQNLAGDKWDGDLIANILQNNNLRKVHTANLLALAEKGANAGINIDYRRLPATQQDKDNFALFIEDLASQLHARRKVLMLTLETPARVSDDPRPEFGWNSGGYDWVRLGRAADSVRVVVAAEAGDQMTALLRALSFATTQVNRQKLQPVIGASSTVVSTKGVSSVSCYDARAMASAIEIANPPEAVIAGESSLTVRYTYLTVADAKTPFVWDPQALQYRFSFKDGDSAGTVWLQEPTSLAYRLSAAAVFAVRGVVLRDPCADRFDASLWTPLRAYATTGTAQVTDPSGDVLRPTWQATGGEVTPGATLAEITWKAPKEAGKYTVEAALPASLGGQKSSVSINVVATTPAPTKAPSAAATPAPTKAPTAAVPSKPIGTKYVSADGDGVYIRSEPDKEARVKVWADGTEMSVLEELPDWYRVQAPDGYVGYIPAEWLADSPPPTPTPRPATAQVPYSPAVGKYPFGYGVQVHAIHNDHGPIFSSITGMGFNWVKQQVEWAVYEPSKGAYNWSELDRLVNSANAAGVRVLFSVLRSPAWANSAPDGPPRNFNDLGDFLGALAARYKGRVHAYEVWNEQNLAREWHGHALSASSYVDLLRIGYSRIKAADPDAVVVAGALTPTGVNDPSIAIDDRLFLRQMYEAGLRGVCDAVGVHPSGFANPPDTSWPNNLSKAPSHNNHPSFYFRNTMEDYHNIMAEYGDGGKQLWPTEFGWAVTPSPQPGYEYAAYNNEATRAQWIVQAYQMSKAWGWVGPMFLWNLNFRIVAPGSEQSAFGIVDAGWRPTASWAALRDMGK